MWKNATKEAEAPFVSSDYGIWQVFEGQPGTKGGHGGKGGVGGLGGFPGRVEIKY